MFFDSNEQSMIADRLRCSNGIIVGVNTVVPHSLAYDWKNPYLKRYINFYEFRKNEFSFPRPSKKIRIPPAFQPIANVPSPEIRLHHMPALESCDSRHGSMDRTMDGMEVIVR